MLLIVKFLVSLAIDVFLGSSLLASLLVIGLTVKTRAPVHCFLDCLDHSLRLSLLIFIDCLMIIWVNAIRYEKYQEIKYIG